MLPLALLLSCLAAADAGAGPPDKSMYWLGNPTPRGFMRAMSTDRPDTTESPITVDAGHVQLEMSFVDYATDRRTADGARTESFTAAPLNFKLGLLDDTDLQVVLQPYLHERTEDALAASVVTDQGFGDVTLRLKHNLWGNDGGETALALMPFITLPTGAAGLSSEHLEGGIIVPFSLALPDDFELGLMAEVDFLHSGGEGATVFLHTAVLGREIVDSLRGFVEYAGVASTHEAYQPSLNTGLVWTLTENLALDLGVRIGLNRHAEDFGLFLGLSIRY